MAVIRSNGFIVRGGELRRISGLKSCRRLVHYYFVAGIVRTVVNSRVPTIKSFGRETSRTMLSVKPWKLDVVIPRRTLSQEAFARTYPGPASAEELALINQLDPGESYRKGVRAKRVVGKALPE